MPPVRNSAALTLATPLGSDVKPIGSWTKVFADNGPTRFSFDIDRQFGWTFAVAIPDLAEVTDTCLAAFGKSLLLRDRQFI